MADYAMEVRMSRTSHLPLTRGTLARGRLRWLAVPPLLLLTLVVACSSDSNDAGAETPEGDGGGGGDQIDGTGRDGEFALTEEELVASIEESESHIAVCMSAAGFQYIAVDADTVLDAMGSINTVPGLTDEGYLDQFGCGISTDLEPEAPALALGQNLQIIEDLSSEDRVAYTRTLLGEDAEAISSCSPSRRRTSRRRVGVPARPSSRSSPRSSSVPHT